MEDKQVKPYHDESMGSKLVIFIGVVLAVLAIGYGLYLYGTSGSKKAESSVQRTRPAAVTSAKAGEVTAEYAGLNQKKNDENYQQAVKQGTSAIPSVIGTAGYLSNSSSFAENAEKALQAGAANTVQCTLEYARKAREAGVNASELKCQGCDAQTLRSAGYTAGELARAGYSASELKSAGYSAQELKNAGFTADQLRAAGFTASDLTKAGYSAKDLLAAGYSPEDLLKAGVTVAALKDAGVSDEALLNAGANPKAVEHNQQCDNLPPAKRQCPIGWAKQQRDKGVSAKALKDYGCSVMVQRQAGFTAGELKDAGYSSTALYCAGYTASDEHMLCHFLPRSRIFTERSCRCRLQHRCNASCRGKARAAKRIGLL